MTTAIDISWAQQYGTAQIYSNGAELALSNSKGQQIGPFVFCKDFLHDALRARIHATPSSIYGYKTGAAELAMIELSQPYVLLANSQIADLNKYLDNILDFMLQADEAMALAWPVPTSYKAATSPPAKYKGGVSYWTGSPLWMISPPAFSLWGLLLRNGKVHEIGRPYRETIQDIINGKLKPGVANDHVYLEYSIPGIDLMTELGLAGVFSPKEPVPEDEDKRAEWFQSVITKNYPTPQALPVSTLHHYGGIVSFSDKSGKKSGLDKLGWKWPTGDKKAPAFCHH